MIQFHAVKWRNLLSTGNAYTTIQLDAHPTTLILGENGSGKSTVLDAICFALFSKPYRNINKPQLVNSINNKNCVVELDFTIGTKVYKIVRGIKPVVFEIWVDGMLLNQDAAARDYQKYLEEHILKLNYKSFTQIVILGAASFTPFMQLPAAARREVIEDILDIKIFTAMNIVLKQKMTDMRERLVQIDSKLTIAKNKAEVQQKYIKTLQEDRQGRIDEILEKINQALADSDAHQANIEDLKFNQDTLIDQITDHAGVISQLNKLFDQAKNLRKQVVELDRDVDFYEENDHCPKCRQGIDAEFKEDVIKDSKIAKKELLFTIGKFEEEGKQLSERLIEIQSINEDITVLSGKINKEQNEIQANHRFIQRMELEKADLIEKVGNIQAEKQALKDIAHEALEVAKERTGLHETQHYYEIAGVLLKDSGIKTRIIKQYLPVINKLVNKFLSVMDFFVQFTLDEKFSEVIKSRYRDEFSYESFSEGEKQRIDLALLFTWRTIAKLKNSASTNLLILDEIFDSSLDDGATEQVMTLLNTLGEGTNVWVISHKGDVFADKFNHSLRFVKRNNFSICT